MMNIEQLEQIGRQIDRQTDRQITTMLYSTRIQYDEAYLLALLPMHECAGSE